MKKSKQVVRDQSNTQADDEVTGKRHVSNNDSAPVYPGDRGETKGPKAGRKKRDNKTPKTGSDNKQQPDKNK